MGTEKLIITPKTRVGELLEAFPELEPVLMDMSPAFEKLKNPVLRRTVARVATLQQVAVVGGLNIDEMINRLRKEVGQSFENTVSGNSESLIADVPEWFSEKRIAVRFDATSIINSGESPMGDILKQAGNLKADEILELKTPFIPAPVLDILRSDKFRIYTITRDTYVLNYICR